MKLIDRNPPTMTGDTKKDIASTLNYLAYLREQLNYILTLLEKEINS